MNGLYEWNNPWSKAFFFCGELGGWGSDGNLQMARNMEVTGL